MIFIALAKIYGLRSNDGWESALIDFVVPHTSPEHPTGCIYGVSLILQRNTYKSHYRNLSLCLDENPIHEIASHRKKISLLSYEFFPPEIVSLIPSFDGQEKIYSRSSKYYQSGDIIGLCLISSINIIPSMRSTLSSFFDDMVKFNCIPSNETSYNLDPTVDLLDLMGKNSKLLCNIIQHYNCPTKNSWIERPIQEQKNYIEKSWDHMLLDTLSPVSIALVFSIILLEQKIAVFSSRRSLLMGCVKSLSTFLRPLDWTHLLVPVVQNSMVGDLLGYPGPFIIGIAADGADGNDWLNELPSDVTLVDLDIGRVILAETIGDKEDGTKSSGLRSQVMYFSEEFGRFVGSQIYPSEWHCDQLCPRNMSSSAETRHKRHLILRDILQMYMEELLSGKFDPARSIACHRFNVDF